MFASHFMRQSLQSLLFIVFAAAAFAQAQPSQKPFEPQVGQDGKDVMWVPTPPVMVNKMLDLAQITARDFLIDLGSGDGITVIAAAKLGARALGIEFNPDMVELSKRNAERAGVSAKAKFVKADLFESDFSQATVITMFLLQDINRRLRPKILDLKPGTRIVSNTFTMGEWKDDETVVLDEEKDGCSYYCTAHLWIVPAKVEGIWQVPQGELALKQSFQMVTGTFKTGHNTTPITNGRLRGDKLSFTASGAEYNGRVNGNSIAGMVKAGSKVVAWSAIRSGKPAPAKN